MQQVKGKKWTSAYLPVWLYSYKDNNNILHYAAVNGRTGETMGSIPLNNKKLVFFSSLIFILILFIPMLIIFISSGIFNFSFYVSAIGLINLFIATALSLIYYFVTKSKYLNKGARHKYEIETKNEITNIKRSDTYIRTLRERDSSTIYGVNNKKIIGEYTSIKNK